MNDPPSHGADPPNHPPVLRFVVPNSLLALLRQRRERQQRARAGVQGSRAVPHALVSLLPSLFSGADATAMAGKYVDGMNNLEEQVEREYDAFLLDPGMGPMTYLAADGRIIVDSRAWDGEGIHVESSPDMAIAAVVVGAKKTGLPELLAIIPRLDPGSTCPRCCGRRWAPLSPGIEGEMVCLMCFGRGEVDERLVARAKESGLWQ